MELEAGRRRSRYEDIFISYHVKDDVQSTYAGAVFHNNRNYQLSSDKNNVSVSYTSFLSFTCFLHPLSYTYYLTLSLIDYVIIQLLNPCIVNLINHPK